METVNERPLSIALLQSEREVLHTPGLDLSAFLTSDPRWDAQLLTDRDFDGLAETASQFDCLVFGFNVLHLSARLRAMLELKPPETGMVILHQLTKEALAFLPEELRVGVVPVDEKKDRVLTPLNRRPGDEILLSWPEDVAVEDVAGSAGVAGSALCYLDNSSRGRWRTVFEVEHDTKRLPVAVRTMRSAPHRIVICNLWIEPTRPAHAALLGNMIRFAALGFPDVAVVAGGTDDGMALLAQKLRVQGTKVVEVREDGPPSPASFSEWPLRDVRRVVVPGDQELPPSWMERGGTVVRVGSAGAVSITGGAPDTAWVAQQWAVWFTSVAPATWHGGMDAAGTKHVGSVFQSRAVLRMLGWIDRHRGSGLNDLECPPPQGFARELGAMIALRIDPDGSLEGTVSATAGARDIHLLTGGTALTKATAARLDSWLLAALREEAQTSLADRLDIVRCLGDADALRAVVADMRDCAMRLGRPLPGTRAESGVIGLSPMIASALRHACAAVFAESDDASVVSLLEGLHEDLAGGLSSNLLLAADYLQAGAAFTKAFPDAPLSLRGVDCTPNLRESISAVGNFGHVVRLGERAAEWEKTLNGEVVSTEALALIEYLGMQTSPGPETQNTHVIASRERGLPPIAVNQLIREVQSTRARLTTANRELRKLARARHLIGALIVVLSIAPVVIAMREQWLNAELPWLAAAIPAFVLLWGLARGQGLTPPWLERAGEAAKSKAPATVGFVLELFGKRDDEQATGKDEGPEDG